MFATYARKMQRKCERSTRTSCQVSNRHARPTIRRSSLYSKHYDRAQHIIRQGVDEQGPEIRFASSAAHQPRLLSIRGGSNLLRFHRTTISTLTSLPFSLCHF
jgi:hypothetical protein